MTRRTTEPDPPEEEQPPVEEGVFVLYDSQGTEFRTRQQTVATRLKHAHGYRDAPPEDDPPPDPATVGGGALDITDLDVASAEEREQQQDGE